jgi:hypothetical protein
MDCGQPERDFFFKNPKLLGFGTQIGLKFFEAFGVFSNIFGQTISTKDWEGKKSAILYSRFLIMKSSGIM